MGNINEDFNMAIHARQFINALASGLRAMNAEPDFLLARPDVDIQGPLLGLDVLHFWFAPGMFNNHLVFPCWRAFREDWMEETCLFVDGFVEQPCSWMPPMLKSVVAPT